MKICFFSTKPYDIIHFNKACKKLDFNETIDFFEPRLQQKTVRLAYGYDVVCAFVNDNLNADILTKLSENGTKLIAMRCAGINNVDMDAAEKLGLKVATVPAYSPESVAEHAVALMLTLNRKIHKAYQRTRDANFSLNGLVGSCIHGKTVGIIGTGRIGRAVIDIMLGFGCKIVAHDPYPNKELEKKGVTYMPLEELYPQCDIISLHCPMTPDNHHLLDAKSMAKLKDGVMIINTSRGGLIDAKAAIKALQNGKIGSLGLDVYENEKELFFEDKSDEVIQDDVFVRLSSAHNVIFTGHQAFLTVEALDAIAEKTIDNFKSAF